MPFKIVRNDITQMQVDVIVNTAKEEPIYSDGVDTAVYKAAGEKELLEESAMHCRPALSSKIQVAFKAT